MTTTLPLREHVLRLFDQHDRSHPGIFTRADTAVAGLNSSAVYLMIQELAYSGQLALTTMPVGVVESGSLVRITNKGRAMCGESANDHSIRNRVLSYIDAHAKAAPTAIATCLQDLEITQVEASRAIVSLAEAGLITHQRGAHCLGVVMVLPSGHKAATALKG